MKSNAFKIYFNLLFVAFLSFTQTRAQESLQADTIYLTDGTSLKVIIEEVGENEIQYKLFTSSNEPVKSIEKSKVVKIIFSNGDEELFAGKDTDKETKPLQENSPQKTETSVNQEKPIPGTLELPKKLSVGIYVQPDFLTGGGHYWKSTDEGFGLDRNLGFGLTFGYRISQKVGVMLNAGYAKWTLLRNYTEEEVFLYKEDVNLLRIPIMAGLRYYVTNGFYLMPEAGTNITKNTTRSTEFGEQVVAFEQSSTPFSYGAAIGFEKQAGPLLLDLSGRYQFTGIEKGQLASIRLGISFLVK